MKWPPLLNYSSITDDQVEFSNEMLVASLPGFTDSFVVVNGINIHYVRGGSGPSIVLLPGWPLTWWAYHKIMPLLARSFDVIAVDLRGMGNSDRPSGGYDKKTMAADIAAIVKKLDLGTVHLAGHDIGAMVAFSFAANYPDQVAKLILFDAMHPEESLYQLSIIPAYDTFDGENLNPAAPYLWWWAFQQVKVFPDLLLEGRVHLLHDWFFNNTLVNTGSIDAFDRSVYNQNYKRRDSIRATNAWFQAFSQDVEDQKSYSLLQLPVLGIAGLSYDWMNAVLPGKVTNLTMVKAENSAHFPADEEPEATAQWITDFLKL